MRVAEAPMRRHSPIRSRLLEAAGAILARGERLTSEALARETGWGRKTVSSRIDHLKQDGNWPHKLERPSSPPRRASREPKPDPADVDRRLLEAAEDVSSRGLTVVQTDLARRLGVSASTAHYMIARLRSRGLWPYPARYVPRDEPPVAVVDPMDVAAVDRARVAEMIDGRHEIDDPPHGVAPRNSITVIAEAWAVWHPPLVCPALVGPPMASPVAAMVRQWKARARRRRAGQPEQVHAENGEARP